MPNRPVAASAIFSAITEPLRRGYRFLKDRVGRGRVRPWAQPVTYLGLAMLAFIYCALAYLTAADRNAAELEAQANGENLVRIIDQSFSNIFKNDDSGLLLIRRSYQSNPSAFALSEWIKGIAVRDERTLGFTIINAGGHVVDTSVTKSAVGLDVSDRDYFQTQRDSTGDELFVSKPVLLRRLNRQAIVLSRRISAPDGTFSGVVASFIDLNGLSKITELINLGPDGSVALVGLDGILRMRTVDGSIDAKNIGRKVPLRPTSLGRALQSKTGQYWSTPGLFNNVLRYVSYRVLDSLPLVSVVTVSQAEIYRSANENARIYWAIVLTLTAAILAAMGFGARREKRLIATTEEMEQAQAALRQSQERYALVEDAVNDGIWDWNILTDQDYRSPRWKEILGYDQDGIAIKASAFRDLIHPADKAIVTEAVRAHLDENKPYDLEFRLRHKNGEYRWVHSRGKALRDANGRPIRMLGSMTDISERKAAEVSVHEDRGNLARAEAMMLLGHYKLDTTTDTLTWSEGTYRIFGKSPESFRPTFSNVVELIHPDDRARFAQHRKDSLQGLSKPPATMRAIKPDGQIITIESWSTPIRDGNGGTSGYFGTVQDVTERLRQQAALQESRDNLTRAEAMISLGHYKYEKDTKTSVWSEGAYRIMGKSPDTFQPTHANAAACFHPDDRSLLLQHRARVLAGESPPPITLRIVKDDGQTALVQSWSTPLRDSHGAITGYFGTVQDVTERQREQAALRESRDNLARAEDMIHMGHFKYESATDTYIWSDGLFHLMGMSRNAFTPTLNNTLERVHPDDRAILLRHRQDVLSGKGVPSVTARAVKGDGSEIVVEVWSSPLRAEDGTITGMFGTTRDVTARRKNEILIEESLANLERAEAMALLGHYKYDATSDNMTISSGTYRIYNKSPASFTPSLDGVLELYHPDSQPILKQYRRDLMAGREPPPIALRLLVDDGTSKEIQIWAAPVRAPDGTVTGMFGTLQDITLRKKAEDALARANNELEARVSQRTAELADEMKRREEAQMTLAQMQKMEVVGQLTAGIAHDFNNLLAVIGGSLEFIDGAAARGLTAEPELIDAAWRATRRGRELVKRLLAFARQSPLLAEATTVDQLVLDTLRLLQRTLGQGIDSVTQLDAKAAVISVDRNQLANALLNLALNARDAMPDGGQLTIATKCQPVTADADKNSSRWPTGEEVCITISDTGVGMTEDVRKRAFEPFFTTKADGLGSGLGLSMVQGFVEQSGGRIEIDSREGHGTTVTIRLPRIASASEADEADAFTGLTVSGREKTVLLVEDDPDVRIVTAAQIKQLGYKVLAVGQRHGGDRFDRVAGDGRHYLDRHRPARRPRRCRTDQGGDAGAAEHGRAVHVRLRSDAETPEVAQNSEHYFSGKAVFEHPSGAGPQ